MYCSQNWPRMDIVKKENEMTDVGKKCEVPKMNQA